MNAFEIYETKENVLADNDKAAARLRNELNQKNVYLVNLMSSPGAGKTTTLMRTIQALKDTYRIGVMEADVDSDTDARTIASAGVKVIQLHTGGSCHMDADMTSRGIERLGMDDLDVVFLENVGNLVCPAEFDVGAQLKVMILSVPEGDDKPLKYPLMFQVSNCLLVNKIDTASIFDFDFNKCAERVHALNPDMMVFPISSLKGDGFENWTDWLKDQIETWRHQNESH